MLLRFLATALILVVSQQAAALSYLKIGFEKVDGPSLTARNINIRINNFNERFTRLRAQADHLKTPVHQQAEISGFSLECKKLLFSVLQISCAEADLSWRHPVIHAEKAKLNLDVAIDSGGISSEIRADIKAGITNLNLSNGQATVTMHHNAAGSSAVVKLQRAGISAALLKRLDMGVNALAELSALASGQVKLSNNTRAISAEVDLAFSEVAFSDRAGTMLGENLHARLIGHLKSDQNPRFSMPLSMDVSTLNLQLQKGELLTPWFYSDFAERPLQLQLEQLKISDKQWSLNLGKLEDNKLAFAFEQLAGSLKQPFSLRRGNFKLSPVRLEHIYDYYLVPVLINDLARLRVEGQMSGRFKFNDSQLASYKLALNDVDLIHQPLSGAPKYSFTQLNLLLDHASDAPHSYLDFEQASFLENIRFGKLHLPLTVGQQKLSVVANSRLPVFDGDLIIENFSMDFSEQAPQVAFQGILTPISLSEITDALGWPGMKGKISGLIPSVTYRDGNARIAGTLLVRAFDGNILLQNVEANHLLSSWPVLKADLALKNIDLQKLTETFSFGKITGAVDGYARNLVLENWQPTQFDAQLITAQSDKPKRISQKAVDNISNLGGAGMAGALSRSFMRFFEDFGYDKLGFSCVLRNGICQMSGVADANQGYYLVKGGGIPRIDVIGHNRSTDWNTLVDRLVNMTSAGSPTIQ